MSSAPAPVTVGIPVHNGEKYLAEALDSVINQTFTDFTIQISDNCSTDRTEEICRTYASEDSRVTYSRTDQNRGAAYNFNRVFELGDSPFFKFAAHDDVILPTFLEACFAILNDGPENAVLAFPGTIEIDEFGASRGVLKDSLDLRHAEPHKRFRQFLRNYHLSNCLFGLIRTSAYRSTGLVGAYDSSDVVLLGELALRGTFLQLDQPLLLRRFHPDMSRMAHNDSTSVARWFDPTRRRSSFRRIRMLREFLRAIDNSPLSTAERLRCRGALFSTWLPKYWKTMAIEISTGLIPRRSAENRRAAVP